MPFDLPEDPDWGKEYFGGIFIVFNEAVLKSDVAPLLEGGIPNCQKAYFLSFRRFQDDGGFKELDIEEDIQYLSPERLKNYFYHRVRATLISDALGEERHRDAMSNTKYDFAFVSVNYGVDKTKVANDIKTMVPSVKKAKVIGWNS